MKPYKWADGPDRHAASGAPVVNPFVGESVARRYAEARPGLHDRVVALLAERLPIPERALDLGCGTGLSTRPLASFARAVVGVDVSEEMLGARASDTGASYVCAQAERLPFRDGVFELMSIASAIHWFAPEAFEEIGRVLRPSAGLVVYDVWFRAQMVGVEAFGEWMRSEMPRRYPSIPKNEFTQANLATIGFAPAWEQDLAFDVSMTLQALVTYLMTHSERIAAVAEGRETEEEQRVHLAQGVGGFFRDAVEREVGFGVRVETFTR
jgi:ubiquinone/menaquinone biosynthesis C-methylase UbiE